MSRKQKRQWMLVSVISPATFAGAAGRTSALPNGASAVNGDTEETEKVIAKIALEDLFKDVWMAEDEEAETGAASPANHVPDTEV